MAIVTGHTYSTFALSCLKEKRCRAKNSTFRMWDTAVTCEWQLLANVHVPSNHSRASGQSYSALLALLPWLSAFEENVSLGNKQK